MINYRDKKLKADDVCMEDVTGMACDMSDMVIAALRGRGLLTPGMGDVLENDAYDDMCDYFEKLFNYPEYRNHN